MLSSMMTRSAWDTTNPNPSLMICCEGLGMAFLPGWNACETLLAIFLPVGNIIGTLLYHTTARRPHWEDFGMVGDFPHSLE